MVAQKKRNIYSLVSLHLHISRTTYPNLTWVNPLQFAKSFRVMETLGQWHNNGVGRVDKVHGATEFRQKMKLIFLISQIMQTLYCHLHKIYK